MESSPASRHGMFAYLFLNCQGGRMPNDASNSPSACIRSLAPIPLQLTKIDWLILVNPNDSLALPWYGVSFVSSKRRDIVIH